MGDATWDRRTFLKQHNGTGGNALPCDPLFTRLLSLASRCDGRTVIRDLNVGLEKNSAQVLSDAVNCREHLRTKLRPETLQAIDKGEEVFISLLAPGGYEFTVGVLAILALGAGASPISPAQPVMEANYYATKARSVAIVVSDSALELGAALAKEMQKTSPDFFCMPVSDSFGQPFRSAESLVIATSGFRDINSPGVVIFTSGTTGPPKGALLPLGAITLGATSFADQLQIKPGDTCQHLLPVHHATGIWVNFWPFLLTGACIEFKSGNFSPEWTWNRWRKGNITHFSGVPTIFMRMMRYWQEVLSKLPFEERNTYRHAAGQIRYALCGTSALPQPINDFWTSMFGGKRIKQRYGSTEQGVIFNMPYDNDESPDGSTGIASLGVDVRLSEGDEGEVRSRSFYMFSKYIHDPEATKAAFDENGFFRSGDMAIKKGQYYFITGRKSVDILKSGGYKISALDVEREILSLPYINEVMVVGVPDEEFSQRIGAVVVLSKSEAAQEYLAQRKRRVGELKLEDLRSDLRGRCAGYKLPTLLRIVENELPKSATGKVRKVELGPRYFPSNWPQLSAEVVQRWIPNRGSQAKL